MLFSSSLFSAMSGVICISEFIDISPGSLDSSLGFILAQVVKSPPAMQETWVELLVWENSLEEDMAIQSSILAWRIPMDKSLVGYSPWGCKQSDTTN